MKVIEPGHVYQVDDLEGHSFQHITFIKKVPHAIIPEELMTEIEGTTNEEVLAVLIDRLNYLYAKLPSDHTKMATNYLVMALDMLNERTRDRKERGVEGKNIN